MEHFLDDHCNKTSRSLTLCLSNILNGERPPKFGSNQTYEYGYKKSELELVFLDDQTVRSTGLGVSQFDNSPSLHKSLLGHYYSVLIN